MRGDRPGATIGAEKSAPLQPRLRHHHGDPPMLPDALVAYGHFLSIFFTLSCIVAEAALYRREMSAATLAWLRRIDLGYLFGAIAIVATGVARVTHFGNGAAFYYDNPIFWIKMALFVAVGLASIPPTIHYIKAAKHFQASEIVIDEGSYRRIRVYLTAELALFAFIPLAATLMARGIGL
jgi:putative membrane protein